MSNGRGNQLTKQVGEYLVAAELARRGFLAATFTGNVPHYDILATDAGGCTLPIQVQGFNVGINSGQVAGQTVFHCHVHLIPRRAGDLADPRGGVRAVIPERAFY